MNSVRKRKSSSRKAGSSRSKVAKNEGPECRPPATQDLQPLSPDHKTVSSLSNEELSSSWRRSSRFKGQSQALSPDPVTEGHAQSTECPPSAEETDESLIIPDDEGHGGGRQTGRRKGGVKRKKEEAGSQQNEDEEEEVEIDRDLDRELENKSRQHNLTSANVRSIIHEVLTNEHVVAMMKAAINETEPVPVFEPKMTRSKLKEVVEKGVVIPAWNISPIKKPKEVKGPQFVDIPLEEEDSSDEEYCPDEEEEDETAEETLLESDLESTASSPRGSRANLHRAHSEWEDDRSCSPAQGSRRSRHLTVDVVPMGPPPPPKSVAPPGPSRGPSECSFMEKLHAVDEELATGSECLESYQSLSGGGGEDSLMAFRTRSKRPLRNVPLGRLEAELRAPDITPDMYEYGSAPEDREWTQWLQGLMSSDNENEEEADDEDDPEYNFLADIDEPDVEDYRNDRAVRITKKEVNELMEELFDTFQDEMGVQDQDEEGHEEEEEKEEDLPQQETPNFSILQTIPYEDPLADILTERYRTVKEQLAALRRRRALLESQGVPWPPPRPVSPPCPMILTQTQKLQLQQQIQQHVQLLTQANMLCSPVEALQAEASTTKQFLIELQMFAQRGEETHGLTDPGFVSIFRSCNLQGAVSLLEELENTPLPENFVFSAVTRHPSMPPHLAWLMATRPVFLYPELLPEVSLDPALHPPRLHKFYTPAEDCLVILGHKHFKDTPNPFKLMAHYLLGARENTQLRLHIREVCLGQSSNIIKSYFLENKFPTMSPACEWVSPTDQRPPVERNEHLMPFWLVRSLEIIYEEVKKYNQSGSDTEFQTTNADGCSSPGEENTPTPTAGRLKGAPKKTIYSFPQGTCYPPTCPKDLVLTFSGFRHLHDSSSNPVSCTQDPSNPTSPKGLTPHALTLSKPGSVKCVKYAKRKPSGQAPFSNLPPPTPPSPALANPNISAVPTSSSPSQAMPSNITTSNLFTSASSNVAFTESSVPDQPPPSSIAPLNSSNSAPSEHITLLITNPSKPVSTNSALVQPSNLLILEPCVLTPLNASKCIPIKASTQPTTNSLRLTLPKPSSNPSHSGTASAEQTKASRKVVSIQPKAVESLQASHTPSMQTSSGVNFSSLGTVTGTGETGIAVSSLATEAQACTNPGNVVINIPSPLSTTIIYPTPAPKVMAHTSSRSARLVKDQMSQRCGTLLKLSKLPTLLPGPKPAPVQPSTAKLLPMSQTATPQFLLLPPGCLVAGNCVKRSNAVLKPKPVQGHIQEPRMAQDTMKGRKDGVQVISGRIQNVPENVEAPQGVSSERPSCEGEPDCVKVAVEEGERAAEPEEENKEENEEDNECGAEEFGEPFLTLSESSGSPTPSLARDEGAEEMTDKKRREKENGAGISQVSAPKPHNSGSEEGENGKAEAGRDKMAKSDVEVMSPASEASVLSVPELQETMEKLTWLASEGRSEDRESSDEDQTSIPQSVPHCDKDFPDSDPLRDCKDVAFAQAYLEKVCETLRVVPGKAEEFLKVLYEFERDLEGRTSVELFNRLKPVLRDWPELLRDFAAFLQPEQAQECGLLEEQRAFERSRRFLRQLELSFGENSACYLKVVRALQDGPSFSHAGSKEMKTQIELLFRGHSHLLEEFWVFFKQLHPSVQCLSDEDDEEDETDSVCSTQTIQSVEESLYCQPIRASLSLDKMERHTARANCMRESDDKVRETDTANQSVGRDTLITGNEDEEVNSDEEEEESLSLDPPVCAKNISLMPSGERIVLWTREADRVILTACQQRGANQSTFHAISTQLGNKTPNEVCARFQDLMRLFQKSTKQLCTEDLDSDTEEPFSADEEKPD
ncbi:GON-4-like protein [Chanos chanos]|uniref:GON-4-like protein n=1 Tax=Chanos chanos TaxID=29144 RepID=A0A6J2WFQ0_CHACN|nr:GON-4-like protein [Chanos chanos]